MTLLADTADSLNWTVLMPVLAGGLAVWYLLPSPSRRPRGLGLLAGLVALAGLAAFLVRGLGDQVPQTVEAGLFFGFSGLAIVSAVLMITGRNPARSALAFAVVVLSTCGLFLLLAAPFLTAATIIVYAGAIVVTFLFVIMLSQQEGPSSADLRSREPELATVAAFILLATLLVGLQRVYDWRAVDGAIAHARLLAEPGPVPREYLPPRVKLDPDQMSPDPLPLTPAAEAFIGEMQTALSRVRVAAPRSSDDPRLTAHRTIEEVANNIQYLELSAFRDPEGEEVPRTCQTIADGLAELKGLQSGSDRFDDETRSPHGEVTPVGGGPRQLPAANVAALGRTLFTDHLLAIELTGTLLLVATIGAIAISSRRREGGHA